MGTLRSTSLAILLLGVAPDFHAQEVSHAFVDVAVIPMSGEPLLEHQTVLISGNRIRMIGSAARSRVPPGAVAIDGRGKFLIPGLGDAHVHLSAPGGPPDLADRALTLLALNGVTMARSMYTEPHHLALLERKRQGQSFWPRLQLASPALSGQSAGNPGTAMELVRQYAAAGYPVIKILPGLSRATFDSVVAEAARQHRRLAGHVPHDVGLEHALSSGFVSLEHLDGMLEWLLPANSPVTPARGGFFGFGLLDAIDRGRIPNLTVLIKGSGATVVPTETSMEMFVSVDSAQVLANRPEMRFVPGALLAQWTQQKEGFVRGVGVTAERAARYRELRRSLIRMLDSAGASIALGSDGWSLFQVPGFSTLRELEVYVAAGLTPLQALRVVTVNVARLMGLEEKAGTIVAGAPADLVLLDADPLADITAIRRQAGVMIDGIWLSGEERERRLEALRVR
jgi:hypothetical protein